jgi:aspartate/methionine/tyrosine aminotransferase
MSDILLAKPVLPAGWIDTSVGEPHVVRENLIKIFDLSEYEVPNVPHMHEYPVPTGYQPLVKLLEEKHHAPVIITNGAKQALGASFYALQQMERLKMGMRTPYWALIPPLAKMHGLECLDEWECGWDGFLSLSPNNPDGFMMDLKELSDRCKGLSIPLIHDAAYYTHVYLPPSYQLKTFGDVQIYSISKMLGLSGLRLGYVVCHSTEFYKLIQNYMENMTVGVSIIPQIFLYDLMRRMNAYPTLTQQFEGQSAYDLEQSKKIALQIDPEVLEVPVDLVNNPGMFLWAKVGPKANFQKAKVNIIDGALFGTPGYIRMNLAFDEKTMQDIVNRLNSAKKTE